MITTNVGNDGNVVWTFDPPLKTVDGGFLISIYRYRASSMEYHIKKLFIDKSGKQMTKYLNEPESPFLDMQALIDEYNRGV